MDPREEFAEPPDQAEQDEFDPREMYPLIAKTAAEAGWADPIMDEYDHYDEHRPKNT